MKYMKFVNGKGLQVVKDVDEACNEFIANIKELFHAEKARNDRLQAENEYLHDEHYKDEEMAAMKKSLDAAHKDLNRGFPISEEEWAAIQEWKRKHEEEKHGADYAAGKMRYSGAIGGSYDYIFTPTSIGTIGEIRCSCGAKFCFQNMV